MIYQDFARDLDTGDLLLNPAGDDLMLTDEPDAWWAEDVMYHARGSYRWAPQLGVGIQSWVQAERPEGLEEEINLHLRKVGLRLTRYEARPQPNGEWAIDIETARLTK